MRRKDREMDKDFARAVIDHSTYGVLSIVDKDGKPYGVPLSIVRLNDKLYFHSAKGGKKVEAMEENKEVWMTFVGQTEVPELFSEEELKEFLNDDKKGATLSSKVFTTEYESAMVFGQVHLVDNESEAVEALRLICQKYTPSKMEYFDLAIKTGLSRTNIYRIDICELTAKRKKFAPSGEELKWGKL